MTQTQSSPLERATVRYAIGFSGAVIIAAIAVLYFEPPVQYFLLGLAVVDGVATPKILEMAVENQDEESATTAS